MRVSNDRKVYTQYIFTNNKKYHPLIDSPKESFGECIRVKYCDNFRVDLANRYCQKCWDKGFGWDLGKALGQPGMKHEGVGENSQGISRGH